MSDRLEDHPEQDIEIRALGGPYDGGIIVVSRLQFLVGYYSHYPYQDDDKYDFRELRDDDGKAFYWFFVHRSYKYSDAKLFEHLIENYHPNLLEKPRSVVSRRPVVAR